MIAKSAELWSPNEPWRAMVVVALFSGLRASELRGLVWDRADLDRRIIQVRQRADFQGTMGSPKSKAGNRDVPLAPMAANVLRQWKLACPKTDGLVFPAKRAARGGVIGHSEVWRAWHQLLDALDLKGYRFHDLRHAAASLLIEQGLQPKRVQAIIGHSSIKMTFDLYGHLWETPEADAVAMEQIEARLLR